MRGVYDRLSPRCHPEFIPAFGRGIFQPYYCRLRAKPRDGRRRQFGSCEIAQSSSRTDAFVKKVWGKRPYRVEPDPKEIKEPSWLEANKGAPTLMLFSVVDDRSAIDAFLSHAEVRRKRDSNATAAFPCGLRVRFLRSRLRRVGCSSETTVDLQAQEDRLRLKRP
jgi:hypothetical protein